MNEFWETVIPVFPASATGCAHNPQGAALLQWFRDGIRQFKEERSGKHVDQEHVLVRRDGQVNGPGAVLHA